MKRPLAAVAAAAVVMVATAAGMSASSQGIVTPARAAAAVPTTLGQVQALYADDLVARINAERAARNSTAVPVPQLQVDGSLEATAQAWSAHLAATGTVVDPPLNNCSGAAANQICAFAANSGNTGYGYWPGDGSDGMDGAYMASAGHRENQLGAAYTAVGVGVTCADNQAWTVELFGYAYGSYPSANARQYSQATTQGTPVPANPVVAGTQTGDPVYCPGQTIGPGGQITATGGQFAYPYAVPQVPGEPIAAPTTVGIASTTDGKGYWTAMSDGTVTDHGDAVDYGSMAGTTLVAPITHIQATPDGRGYWLVAADGGIFSFGDAGFYGSMGGKVLNAPVVGLAPTPDGKGYYLVASDGGIFTFGDARFGGSMGGQHLNAPVVGIAVDRQTGGYWMVASDGGVFSFGAPFYGSTGSIHLNRPVNGVASTPDGNGYWFVASDGGIFSFGDAGFAGSAGGLQLSAPVVGMSAGPAHTGYWLIGADGGVFAFGVPYLGRG